MEYAVLATVRIRLTVFRLMTPCCVIPTATLILPTSEPDSVKINEICFYDDEMVLIYQNKRRHIPCDHNIGTGNLWLNSQQPIHHDT
jgi:hypothetical protein